MGVTTEMIKGMAWPAKKESQEANIAAAVLPEGLVFHCQQCRLVIPSDAPLPDGADCMFVARNKLAWFNTKETLAHQFCGAVATWELIHDAPLRTGHAESLEYKGQFKADRKGHFDRSAARKAMSDEHMELVRTSTLREHMRDRKLGLID